MKRYVDVAKSSSSAMKRPLSFEEDIVVSHNTIIIPPILYEMSFQCSV